MRIIRATSALSATLLLLATPAIALGLPASADPASTVTSSADVRVVATADGSTITWSPKDPPTGDARPMVVVDGTTVGAALGRTVFRLTVPGRRLTADDVSITVGSRTVAGPTVQAERATATVISDVARAKTLLRPDPGARGRYATTEFTYSRPSVKLAKMPVKVEMRAVVVMPKGATGKRPVVLFLHGRHETCYRGSSSSSDWPCPSGWTPIPSYRGYLQTQQLLASQGYVTVSISANGINAQDADLDDAGAAARSALVRDHLTLLAQWESGTGPADPARSRLAGHLDMRQIVTVGHSRGGEGVVRAAIDEESSDPFRIVGQVLIAPTDFGEEVAPGIATTVLLPECDGDVSDLEGQQYVDGGRDLVAGDNSLKTAVMVIGADHNFFNTAWTPGATKAPASDDWSGSNSDACSPTRSLRLKPAQQRAVGATYVAAAVRAYTHADTTSVHLLDGSAVRAASIGSAIAYSSAIGGHRAALMIGGSSVPATTGKMVASICAGPLSKPSCGGSGESPHWNSWSQFSSSLQPKALQLRWTAAGASARLSGAVRAGTRAHIDVRTIASAGSRLKLRVTDRDGHSALLSPDRASGTIVATGGRAWGWAQDLRFTLPRAGFDRSAIESADLVSASVSGSAVVLDAWATNDQLAASTVDPASVPRVNIADQSMTVTASGGKATVQVPLTISNSSSLPSRLWVQRSSWFDTGDGGAFVTVPAGSSTVNFPLTVTGLSSGESTTVELAVKSAKEAEVSDYIGAVTITAR